MEDEHLWFRTGPREMTALSEICFISSFLRGLQLPGEAADIWGLSCITAFCVRALLLLCVCDSTARCTLTLRLPELPVLDRCCHHPALLTELCNLSPWELPRYTNTTEAPFKKKKYYISNLFKTQAMSCSVRGVPWQAEVWKMNY